MSVGSEEAASGRPSATITSSVRHCSCSACRASRACASRTNWLVLGCVSTPEHAAGATVRALEVDSSSRRRARSRSPVAIVASIVAVR
eukprot:scaffold3894_cov127-Isochrysis_galbana.AAC.4